MKRNLILTVAAMALSLNAAAQTSITFDRADYGRLGVYDSWAESPFRTGQLEGNWAVVDNHLNNTADIYGLNPNTSHKMLAVQRSRYGSNTFGASIELLPQQQFELTPNERYVHLMINRPYSGRIMVIGLGKRDDRPGQNPQAEQFWAMSTAPVPANQWEEVVLPFKGNGGITINTLVIVPDCESPHAYTDDRICYIDNIEINDNPLPRYTFTTEAKAAAAAESHYDWCNVNDANRNGEVLTANGERLVKFKALPGKDFHIKMHPENGFTYEGAIIKYGRNLNGEAVVGGKTMWRTVRAERNEFDKDDCLTIPGRFMQGDVEIEGLFIEVKK